MIRGLPYDAELEYLESTGTQWIDTGVVFNPETDAIEATLAVTQAPTLVQRAVFGARFRNTSETGYSYLGLMCQQNALTARIYPGYIALGDFTSSLQPLKYKFGIQGQYQGDFSFGGTTSTFVFPTSGTAPTNPLCLFAYGSGADSAFGAISDARIGIFKIFRNGVLVRDFRPIAIGNTGYMYDRVSKRLFGNSGTGAFVLGPDKARPVLSLHRCASKAVLPPRARWVEYLESTGTQWIDTGVVFNPETDAIEATLAVTQAPTLVQRAVFGARFRNTSETGYSYLGLMCQQNALTARIYPGYIALGDFTSSLQPLKYKFGIQGQYQGDFSFGGTTSTFVFPTSGTAPTNPLCLFAYGSGADSAFGAISDARIGIFKIFRNGVLVRDFRPIAIGNTGYMLDLVSGEYLPYGNKGTGDFIIGPDAQAPTEGSVRSFGKMGAGARMMTPFVVPTTLDDLAAVVRAFGSNREAARAFLCPQDSMVELPDTWTAENGTVYSNPQQVVDVDFMENESGETLLYAICIPKYASTVTLPFDQRNQEPAVEATAQSGVDYYGFAAPHDPAHAYASGECCTHDGALYRASAAITANTAWDSSKWTLQGYVSADGTIPVYSEEATYPANSIVRYTSTALGFTGMFKNSAAITTAGAFDPARWALFIVDAAEASFIEQTYSEGDALDYSGYAALMRTDLKVSSGNGVKNALRYGSNNWGRSAQRQYFNNESDTPHGWFHQTHPGQIAPFLNIGQMANSATSTNYGYRHGCSAELLRNVHAVKVPTWPNYVTDGPNNASTIYHTLDTFWLPSGEQWVGSVNANEGEVFPGLLWQCIRALKAAGCKVVPYDATAEGEVGTVYVDTSNGRFYTYRPDITSGTKYSDFTNDDGVWFRNYLNRTIEEVPTNADRGSDASKVYFVTSTQKMWLVNGSSWTEMSHEWYTYNAIGKPASEVSPLNGSRRSFAVTNHNSAPYVRLRSAYRGTSHYAWLCSSYGYVGNSAAHSGYAGRPACAIR